MYVGRVLSEAGAEVCGINATVTKRIAFTLGSALAGLAGALTIFQSTIAPTSALNYTVLAFVMIALGGLGNYGGAFIGALCLALITSFTSSVRSDIWWTLFQGATKCGPSSRWSGWTLPNVVTTTTVDLRTWKQTSQEPKMATSRRATIIVNGFFFIAID